MLLGRFEPAGLPLWQRSAPFRPVLVAVAVLVVLALAWTAAGRLLDEVSYADLTAALEGTPAWAIAAALALTGVSFAALIV